MAVNSSLACDAVLCEQHDGIPPVGTCTAPGSKYPWVPGHQARPPFLPKKALWSSDAKNAIEFALRLRLPAFGFFVLPCL